MLSGVSASGPKAKAKAPTPPTGDNGPSIKPNVPSTEREDSLSTTTSALGPEVAKALVAELVPKLQLALAGSHRAFLDQVKEERTRLEAAFQQPNNDMSKLSKKLDALLPDIDSLVPKLDKVLESIDVLERKGVPVAAPAPPTPTSPTRLASGGMNFGRKGSMVADPQTPAMESRRSDMPAFREARTVGSIRRPSSTRSTSDARRLQQVLKLADQEEPEEEGEEDVNGDRTIVVNIRRFRFMLEVSNVFLQLMRWGGMAVVIITVLSRGMWLADWVFLVAAVIQHYVHFMRHSVFAVATDRFFGFGEHFGDDGQDLLDMLAPGLENPSSCIQAMTWRRKTFDVVVKGCLLFLCTLCGLVWALLFFNGIRARFLPDDEVNHVMVLTIIGTANLALTLSFGWLINREMHYVLPPRKDGRPWDVVQHGVPGPLGHFLGAPCIWFGSEVAYDDLRVWASLASQRRSWTIVQSVPGIFPEELGIYALQSRETAARLAHSLYGAKLFDSHRQAFVKRQPEDVVTDGRPSMVLTGLLGNAERGHLYDIDVRRELPEALRLNLVLYDSRTKLMWTPRRVARDPLDWVRVRKWLGTTARPEEVAEEMPIWNQDFVLGSNAKSNMFSGTFSGFRVVISVSRSDYVGEMADIQAEIAALKKLGEHPNILGLLTSGVSPEGQQYMGMESYEAVGCLLSHLANHHSWNGGSLPVSMATRFFQDILGAVSHMHNHGLLHRSLRAEGVVITHDHRARLADVGVVSKMGTRETLRASHVAPEVCRGFQQGAAVDCWGVGVILHQVYQGRADIIDCRSSPPRQRPGTPSTMREMDLLIKNAIFGLLKFDPNQRWTLEGLADSYWFRQSTASASSSYDAPPAEFEQRHHLRRFFGRAPPPTVCAVHISPDFKGIIGKALGAIKFEDADLHVLLVVRSTGAFIVPKTSLKLEVGDYICFGLLPDDDTEMMLSRLDEKLEAAASEIPVTGFERVLLNGLATTAAPRRASAKLMPEKRFVLFHAEFDCFIYPSHTARTGRETVGMLQEVGVHIMGLLRPGQWQPDWFVSKNTQVQPGDLALILRAPRQDGSSVPSLSDSDLDCVMDEQELIARLAVARGLQDAI